MRQTAFQISLLVSCNPHTAVRDIALLIAAGWQMEEVQMIDQFVRTAHTEIVTKQSLTAGRIQEDDWALFRHSAWASHLHLAGAGVLGLLRRVAEQDEHPAASYRPLMMSG